MDKGIIEVTNCFCVPHKEHDDQVEAELSYALDLYELNRRVNPSENIVGEWIWAKLDTLGGIDWAHSASHFLVLLRRRRENEPKMR